MKLIIAYVDEGATRPLKLTSREMAKRILGEKEFTRLENERILREQGCVIRSL